MVRLLIDCIQFGLFGVLIGVCGHHFPTWQFWSLLAGAFVISIVSHLTGYIRGLDRA